jgi:glycosyltransferase involved in cell wall biosynthesis
MPEVRELFQEFHDMPVVAISESQRGQQHWLNWQGVIHHGVPETRYRLRDGDGGYLAFLGRISPEKRVDLAIRTAIELNMQLVIAAKCDRADLEYFEYMVKPLLGHPLVEYVGEIGDDEKEAFLGGATALLFPIDWPEPFGMVVIEALACGTPVVATARGSVPELLDHGVTGALVSQAAGLSGLVNGAALAQTLDRQQIRQVFERRFTAERMALEYLMLYERMRALPTRLTSTKKVAAFD